MEIDIEVEVDIEVNMEVAGIGRDTTQTFHIFISFLSCVIHTSTGAWSPLFWGAEICQLYHTVVAHQTVCTFKVSMDDTMSMQVLETDEKLSVWESLRDK